MPDVAEVIDATPPGGPPPAGAGRFAVGRMPVTSELARFTAEYDHVPLDTWAIPVEEPLLPPVPP
jgi:hypothetical protein